MTVVPYQPQARERPWLELLPAAAELANMISGTDFVPTSFRSNSAAIAAAVLYGDEVGIGPMQSLAHIAVINGRPTLSSEAQRALILQAGHEMYPEETTTTRCTMVGRRKNSDAITRITWTMDDAKRAGLAGKQNWRMYPRQMLQARASAELARAVFPDAIGGLAATEELEDQPDLPDNGSAPAPSSPSRRRRRANVTASAAPAQEQPAQPQSTTPLDNVAGGLPPNEQAIVDALTSELDATPVETDAPAMINESQRRKLHAMFRSKDIDDRDARLLYCTRVAGRDIKTSTELTSEEASRIIDHLDQLDMNNPHTWPPIPDTDEEEN